MVMNEIALTVDTMFSSQINVATQRGFIPVDERMRVIDGNGKLVSVIFICTPYDLAPILNESTLG